MKKQYLFKSLIILIISLFLLTGCGGFDPYSILPEGIFPATPGVESTEPPEIPETDQGVSHTQTPTPTPPQVINIWLPPTFDPESGSAAGRLLKERLQSFQAQHSDVQIQVRIKAPSGQGGMIDSLSTANAAAPLAVPSIVLLSQNELETAALKGLVCSLDDMTTLMKGEDWYPFAKQMGQIQDKVFGVPIAADAMLLVYRPENLSGPKNSWQELIELNQPILFPASDPNALFTLNMYLSNSGEINNEQNKPMLDAESLEEVLLYYADASIFGAFPYWLTQFENDDQIWQDYREQNANICITWTSRYLSELPADSVAAPLKELFSNQPHTLVTGWSWAISESNPTKQEISVQLIEYLSEPEYLANWTSTSGYLPTRPSSIQSMENPTIRWLLSEIALSGKPLPSNDVLFALGPILKSVTIQTLKQQTDPAQAAQDAAKQLNPP
ncbi:MAG: extracellular solute-binding protein [Anaerolineaceae bacterium]|nr:extracellular solute-binding protein [Anaerolineaceae bacterium]